MEFRERIKALRKEKGMTQAELAAFAGKGEGAVRAWETDKSKPDCDTLIKLAEYFDCTTDYLLGLDRFKSQEDVESYFSTEKSLISALERLSEAHKRDLLNVLAKLLNYVDISYTDADMCISEDADIHKERIITTLESLANMFEATAMGINLLKDRAWGEETSELVTMILKKIEFEKNIVTQLVDDAYVVVNYYIVSKLPDGILKSTLENMNYADVGVFFYDDEITEEGD